MRKRPIGSSDARPVPSLAMSGPSSRSSQSCTRAPRSTPAAPSPTRPRNTRRPTGRAGRLGGGSGARRSSTTTTRVRSRDRRIVDRPRTPALVIGRAVRLRSGANLAHRHEGTTAWRPARPTLGHSGLRRRASSPPATIGYDEARAVFNAHDRPPPVDDRGVHLDRRRRGGGELRPRAGPARSRSTAAGTA